MIRRTLCSTSAATFCVQLPDPNKQNLPTPAGTGFFVSPDGWFLTAAHVVCRDGKERKDVSAGWLVKEHGYDGPGSMCQFFSLEYTNVDLDLALIKVSFEKNKNKHWLKDRSSFHTSLSHQDCYLLESRFIVLDILFPMEK